jgi:hypothetical protein
MPVIIRNGNPVTVTDEEAAQLTRLSGNELETPVAALQRARTTAEEEYYTSGGQQVIAGVEGLASGATIGLSDLILADDETRARARHNPGIRLGSELVGAIAPALISGGTGTAASIAKMTPSALAARAGGAASKALGRGLPTALAVEGAIQGAGSAAARATLNNDPLTIEAVISGAGMGGLLGAGVGVLSRGAAKAGVGAERRLAQADLEAAQATLSRRSPSLVSASATADELVRAAKRSMKTINTEVKTGISAQMRTLERSGSEIATKAMSAPLATKSVVAKSMASAKSSMAKAQAAFKANNVDEALTHINAYTDALNTAGTALGSATPIPHHVIKSTESLADISTLSKMPNTPAKWAGVSSEYIPRLRRALEPAGDELDGLRADLADRLRESLTDSGIAAGTTLDDLATGLGGLKDHARASFKKVAGGEIASHKREEGFLGFLKRSASQAAARGASAAARGRGGGAVLSSLAYQSGSGLMGLLASEFIGLRAAAVQHVDQVIAAVGPRAARALRRVGPVSENLRRSVMDSEEPAGRPKNATNRELAKERMDEMARLAPQINDIAYSAVEPVMGASPEVALAMSQRLVSNFQHMFSAAPRDPGGTHVGLKSGWLPSETQALTMASVMEAVMAPMDALDRMLQGDGDPAAAEALWACYPSLMEEAASRLVEKLPELQDKTDLATRAALSTAFRVPLDGLLTQQSIVALQATFGPPAPQQMGPPSPGNSNPKPNGRPPAVNSSSVTQTRTQSLQSSFGG